MKKIAIYIFLFITLQLFGGVVNYVYTTTCDLNELSRKENGIPTPVEHCSRKIGSPFPVVLEDKIHANYDSSGEDKTNTNHESSVYDYFYMFLLNGFFIFSFLFFIEKSVLFFDITQKKLLNSFAYLVSFTLISLILLMSFIVLFVDFHISTFTILDGVLRFTGLGALASLFTITILNPFSYFTFYISKTSAAIISLLSLLIIWITTKLLAKETKHNIMLTSIGVSIFIYLFIGATLALLEVNVYI